MFQRFHEMRERREDGGFTLIELLVVVLIIAILAAIAIPFFLRQRERSFESQAQSSLKNGATAMESFATQNGGTYPVADPLVQAGDSLVDEHGYRPSATAPLEVATGGTNYCLEVNHTQLAGDWRYEAVDGAPEAGSCP